MRYLFTLSVVFLALFGLNNAAFAQLSESNYDWKLKRDKDGVQIYTSVVEDSSYKAVRGKMLVEAPLTALVALVEDLPRCSEWAALCKTARVEKRVSPTESYVYILNDLPFPVSNRDVYTHVVWNFNDMFSEITMTSTATPDVFPNTKAVRIEQAMSQWRFTDQADGTVLVESYAHINPNGPTPAWITNMMLIDSPFTSMREMRKIVEAGGYGDAIIAFDPREMQDSEKEPVQVKGQ